QVPYTGMKGDISKVPIMDTDSGFPVLTMLDGDKIKEIPAGQVPFFDMENTRPVILTRLGSHTPAFTIRVYDNKKTFVGYLFSINSKIAARPLGRQSNLDKEGKINFTSWVW